MTVNEKAQAAVFKIKYYMERLHDADFGNLTLVVGLGLDAYLTKNPDVLNVQKKFKKYMVNSRLKSCDFIIGVSGNIG